MEADEAFQNAGEKGVAHDDPDDPARRRANKQRGRGTFANDRPPIIGLVGRERGQVRLRVGQHTGCTVVEPFVEGQTVDQAIVNTDEWNGYNPLAQSGRQRKRVFPSATPPEWARDDDGDGVREVHVNTLEGLWTGLRNFLRPFRGISKHFLSGYVALFEWAQNIKRLTAEFLQTMLRCTPKAT